VRCWIITVLLFPYCWGIGALGAATGAGEVGFSKEPLRTLPPVFPLLLGRLGLELEEVPDELFLEELEELEEVPDELFLEGLEELEGLGEVLLERLELELELELEEDDRPLLPPLLLAKASRLICNHLPPLTGVKVTVTSPAIKKTSAVQHKSGFFNISFSAKNRMLNPDC
jgi:hypothetical protein